MKKPALCFLLLAVPASAQEMDGMAMHGALGGYAMQTEVLGSGPAAWTWGRPTWAG